MFYGRNYVPTLRNEIENFQNEMNRLFDLYSPERYFSVTNFPAMNLYADDNHALITAELTGVDVKDLDIRIAGDTLMLSGSREPEASGDKVRYHRQERDYGKFNRSIQLPFPVESDKIEASLEKGILMISLPRAESDKPKTISVNSIE
ncbi:MAG TPA: Hsp20/alpha crystallin family protein [Anaerolineaceae bacterium]|nr:Hsp20/alpha crystallin family protein [Anaerolineaceae bacterium]